ncbi:efflux RND transporter permease subunit [bacterium]|nr:efflux RND transporter permease subunit [bacterium]MBU1994850.1 efflux RND transporter permease subunit [bacterium]
MKSNSFIEVILNRPSFVFSFLTLFIFLGIMGYTKINHKLFPDSNYPQIAVVIVQNGSSAKSMATNIAVNVEEELYTLDKVRRVYSTTIDEVSVINAEFEYSKDIDAAANDVSNALEKTKSKLPSTILSPQIIKITSATAPIITMALSAKNDTLSLENIRELAETKLKHKLLKVDGVSNVEIFGGYKKEIQVMIDKKKLELLNLNLAQVIASISANNQDFAAGFINNEKSRYLLKASLKKDSIEALKNIQITQAIQLGDIANISLSHYENSAEYFGNSKASIALSIQRGESDDIVKTIQNVEKEIELLKKKYQNINFEVSDTQKDTIVQSTNNMFESLRDAIIMSTIVVFFFLASFRQVLVVLLTIPIVYAATIALMWIVGIEFNVVTLTAIILALGLLLDDTVVVMENIQRHYKELHDDIHKAVFSGTKEIMFADLSGTITTMIALAPMLFVGGYPQTVFQPLVGTLLLALFASYIISITAVPLLSLKILAIDNKYILTSEEFFHKYFGRVTDFVQNFFTNSVKMALESKKIAFLYFLVLLFLFFTSIKGIMPTVGRELMPPMDTGGVKIAIKVDSNLPISKSQEIIKQVDAILNKHGKILRISSSIGSEAGVLSIGSGSGLDNILIVATYVDRYKREASIWDIEKNLRQEIAKVENIKQFEVVDYGATALASIRANLDVTLYSENINDLLTAGDMVEEAMYKTRGIVSVSRTWHVDKIVYDLGIDEKTAHSYNISSAEILSQVQTLLRGGLASSYIRENSSDYLIRVWVNQSQRQNIEEILSTKISTKTGFVELKKLAKVKKLVEPTLITREGLEYTLNIYGYREKAAISHIMSSFEEHASDIALPSSVTMEQTGDIKQFENSAKRMIGAIAFAIVLIFITLITLFNSVKISLMILVSIPLTVIGASWLMLILNYHTSMPAMMGFILLSGVIVNNAILLIHFALQRMKEGLNKREAMLESIKIRTRPVLMTAFAVTAGMIPVALGSAIGLERLAPLGAVAIGGLIVGTFLTLLFIPLIFIWSTKEKDAESL